MVTERGMENIEVIVETEEIVRGFPKAKQFMNLKSGMKQVTSEIEGFVIEQRRVSDTSVSSYLTRTKEFVCDETPSNGTWYKWNHMKPIPFQRGNRPNPGQKRKCAILTTFT
jgi:hypothetical protein